MEENNKKNHEETTQDPGETMAEEELQEETVLEETVSDQPTDPEKEIAELKDRYMRLNAEYMNFKKRTEKEKADIYKYASERFFKDLLPVIDNIERALGSIEGADDHKAVVEGVNLIKKSFDDFLEKSGVKVIEAVGTPFDPTLHHAVMTAVDDSVEDETVIDTFQVGYTLNDKVIRPSMVKVSKKSE